MLWGLVVVLCAGEKIGDSIKCVRDSIIGDLTPPARPVMIHKAFAYLFTKPKTF